VFINNDAAGVFALFSRRPHAYGSSDLALVERLAAYIAVGLAHQRLSETARHAAVERARAASIDNPGHGTRRGAFRRSPRSICR
jgi:GAF domain-containing protein